jgi:uncharacterized protein
MEQRISIVTLGVSELKQSREFYQRLGWRPSPASSEEIVFFQSGGAALALYPRAALAKDANLEAEDQGFGGITIAYNARNQEEVDSVLAAAAAAGARILKPGQKALWGGYSGYFSDPDNFVWEVAYNPFFSISADGNIMLSTPQT